MAPTLLLITALAGVLQAIGYVAAIVLAFALIVLVHEAGHFFAARLFGMRVEVFALGFGRPLARLRRGETEYRVGLVPLGGYVQIAGMADDDLEGDWRTPEPWEYRAKPIWQRCVVISAGVVANLVLAALLFAGAYGLAGASVLPASALHALPDGLHVAPGSFYDAAGVRTGDAVLAVDDRPVQTFEELLQTDALAGRPFTLTVRRGADTLRLEVAGASAAAGLAPGLTYAPSLLGRIVEGGPADAAGLRAGDRIVGVDGEPVRHWVAMTAALQRAARRADGRVTLAWERDGVRHRAPVQLDREAGPAEATTWKLGVALSDDALRALGRTERRLGLAAALARGTQDVGRVVDAMATGLGRLFQGHAQEVAGPVQIAKATGDAALAGGSVYWRLVAIVSIAVAFMNALPVPALDGGHLVLLLVEGLRGRPLPKQVQLRVERAGLSLVTATALFVIGRDLVVLFGA